MKIRSISQLQDELDSGFGWRVKEIAALKMSVESKSMSIAQATLIRAGVPLLYAHWEGFIKKSSQDYLEYVGNQRLKYSELSSCFVVFGAKKHLSHVVESRRAEVNIAAVDFFRSCPDTRADLVLSNAINTKSNLKSEVFVDIALSLGVPIDSYDAYFKLIDESLLARRNAIAHGEYLDLDANAFRALADEVINLLRMYKTDLQNLASVGAFRLKAA
ncbi:MAG: MAE_28990/MAE_18760 family HEPN-like nuclease [Rhodocyclaceae bacterium]